MESEQSVVEHTSDSLLQPTLEEVMRLAKRLSPLEKIRLIEHIIPDLESEISKAKQERQTVRSVYGIMSHMGPAPTEEDIDEARREMMSGFPRHDLP
jgi:hypothetical protein